MSLRFLQLEGFIRAEPPAALRAMSDAVSEAGGWILQAQAFSNIALGFSFEVPARRVGGLQASLDRAGIRLYEGFDRAIREATPDDPDEREIPCSMLVTLIHDRPDEPGFVPPVPG